MFVFTHSFGKIQIEIVISTRLESVGKYRLGAAILVRLSAIKAAVFCSFLKFSFGICTLRIFTNNACFITT